MGAWRRRWAPCHVVVEAADIAMTGWPCSNVRCAFYPHKAELYRGLRKLYPADFDPSQMRAEDSGKLLALVTLLEQLHQATPSERVVLVSNYTQVYIRRCG